MFYFYTMDMFGNIPLVTDYNTPVSDIRQSPRSEVFRFIFNELQEVVPYLKNERSNELGNYYGRFTRPVAYFLLAKLALNAEVYSDNDWTDGIRPDGRSLTDRLEKDYAAFQKASDKGKTTKLTTSTESEQ